MKAIFDYEPLTDDEQEILQRLKDDNDLYVEIKDWGYHLNPHITVGDKRIQVRFPMHFVKPFFPQPVWSFTLLLKTRDGRTLYQSKESTMYDNQPLMVQAGLDVDLAWDIQIGQISAEFQSLIRPGFVGRQVMSIPGADV